MSARLPALGAASMLLLGGLSMAAELQSGTQNAWNTLDIIPMPKEILLSGKCLPLDEHVVLVLGPAACKQSRIGADWINERIVERGGTPLAILTGDAIPAEKTTVIIGTWDDNPLIAAAVKNGVLTIGAKNPGKRGYEIRTSADGRKIYLGGADPLGALYSCVTFGELLNGKGRDLAWSSAAVRDWPDQISLFSLNDTFSTHDAAFPALPAQLTEANKKKYLDGVKKFHDYLLRRKITGVNYRNMTLRGEKFIQAPWMDLRREGIEHGKARGIGALIYAEKPYPGLAKYYPEQAKATNTLTPDTLHAGDAKWLMSWSHDDIRRETARNLAAYVKAVGFTDVGFHDTDGGWLDNPALWNFRSPADRARWGDDYTAATIHIHKTYYDELKKINPELNIHFTFYPYTVYIFDSHAFGNIMDQTVGKNANAAAVIKDYQKKYGEFWRRLSQSFPYPGVTFCARESTWDSIVEWRKFIAADRAIFWWNAVGSKYWEPIFSQGPAWAADFADHPGNVIAIAYADTEGMPLNTFAIREYSWNRQTPGAAHFKPFYGQLTDAWKWAEPEGDIYTMVLPKIVRNIFGRQAAPYIVRAVSRNIDIRQALGRVRSSTYDLLKTPERRQWQADNAEQAADALNELWAKCRETHTSMGMDDRAFCAFIVMREALNGCKWFSKAKAQLMLAEVSAGENNLEKARQYIARAGDYARAGSALMPQLVAERPEAIRQVKLPAAKMFTADAIDFRALSAAIADTASNLVTIAESSSRYKLILDTLARGRKVGGYLVNGTAAIQMDGVPNEPAWSRAPSVDCFTIIGQKKLADAFTRVKIVRDTDHLYIAWVCHAPPGKTILDKDTLDIFLKVPEVNPEKLLEVFISASGFFYSSMPDAGMITRAIKREQDLWSGELRLRIAGRAQAAAKPAPWAINVCRNCFYQDSPTQISAILPFNATSKRSLDAFPIIQFSTLAAPAPAAAINVKDFKTQTVTLPDRIASVASFRVAIDANMVLNQAALLAETYGPDGKLQRSRKLAEFANIYLREEPAVVYEAESTETVGKGGVLLILKSREGEFKRWVRFGGWEGANGVGDIFSPPGWNGGKALAGPCFFPSQIEVDAGPANLIDASQGTIELWMTPSRAERPSGSAPASAQGEAIVSFSAFKKNANPIAVKGQPLGIVLYKNAQIAFIAGERARGAWSTLGFLPDPLATGKWYHLACVWDAAASAENQARLYFNGKRLPAAIDAKSAEHLTDTSIRVGIAPPHTIQIGALKSGYYAANLLINAFRISRTARYTDDFTPETQAFLLDKDTSALFPFSGALEGSGMTVSGHAYKLQATAGIDF